MNSKASSRRKDKAVPMSKNAVSKNERPPHHAKKDGHGKFNWGKQLDYVYPLDAAEGDDPRVLDDHVRDDTSVSVIVTCGTSTTRSTTATV